MGRLIGAIAFPEEELRKRIRSPVGGPVPHLERNPPPIGIIKHLRHGPPRAPWPSLAVHAWKPWSGGLVGRGVRPDELIVVPDARQQQPTRREAGPYLGDSHAQVSILQQVRECVITAQHHIKRVRHLRVKSAEIGHTAGQGRPERRRFPGRTRDGRGAEVRRTDSVALRRQANGLRADPAGTVQHGAGRGSDLTADEAVEHLTLL